MSTATIHPANPFNAGDDAKSLHQAITGSNKEAITNLLTRRSGEQRVTIAQAYNTAYKMNLVEYLASELSGDYRDLVVAMVTPLPEYYAKELFSDGSSSAVVDILPTSSNADLKAIEEAYTRLKLHHRLSLVQALKIGAQGLPTRVIEGAFKGLRNESQEVDVEAAIADAKLIYSLGEGKTGPLRTFIDDKDIEGIFITRSYKQLHQIFEEYNKLYGHGIEKAFKDRGFNNEMENGFLNMISVIKSMPNYFATRLYDSMHGPGTTDKLLIRIIVGRSEIDLGDIREAFQKMYGYSLTSTIKDDTSGEYRRALLTIVKS